jgi:hypothetical protein
MVNVNNDEVAKVGEEDKVNNLCIIDGTDDGLELRLGAEE